MDETPPKPPGDEERHEPRQVRAREYESIHNRMFVARIAVTAVLLTLYLFTGASMQLAQGLENRFDDAWWLVNSVYIVVTLFFFSAIMFPLSMYGDYYIERRYGLSKQSANSWFMDYLKGLILELVLMTLFLWVIYALFRWTPDYWWVWATLVYIFLAVVLSAVAPVVIMPLFHKFEPLEESELTRAVSDFVERAGLNVIGVYKWGLQEKTETANAALAGLGRTRRIILGDTMLNDYTRDEILAVLAHEVGHYRNRDMLRLIVTGSVLAFLGFYAADIVLRALVDVLGFAGVHDIGAFPVFIFALFVFSLVVMPLSNAYSRKREFAADAYAVRAMDSSEPLIGALNKLADQNLADREPPAWIEFLLHGHPSISRRIEHARSINRPND